MSKSGIFVLDEKFSKANTKKLFEDFQMREKEKATYRFLTFSLSELNFTKDEFIQRLKSIDSEGTDEFDHYKTEINNMPKSSEHIVFFMDTALSANFKAYLLYLKSSLDKLVKLFAIRHKHNKCPKDFKNEGRVLINFIRDKYEGGNSNELSELIVEHKKLWLDDTIKLRDKVAHNTDLQEYWHHHLDMEFKKEINSLSELTPPTLKLNGKMITAEKFLEQSYETFFAFIHDFLRLSGFGK